MFLWLGDIVYNDAAFLEIIRWNDSIQNMKQKYDEQKLVEGYKALVDEKANRGMEILGIWGKNKQIIRNIYYNFFFVLLLII
jgi:hypothetical protein